MFFNLFFWLYVQACGTSQTGIKPKLPPVAMQSLNHWTPRENLMPLNSFSALEWLPFCRWVCRRGLNSPTLPHPLLQASQAHKRLVRSGQDPPGLWGIL